MLTLAQQKHITTERLKVSSHQEKERQNRRQIPGRVSVRW